MSEKTTCPGCDAYTSSVFNAFEEWRPCPYCGLSAEAADAVTRARERKATADLAERILATEKRAGKAEREAAALRAALDRVRSALSSCLCGATSFDFPDRKHEPGCPRAKERP